MEDPDFHKVEENMYFLLVVNKVVNHQSQFPYDLVVLMVENTCSIPHCQMLHIALVIIMKGKNLC